MMSQINGHETRVRARKNHTTVEIHFYTSLPRRHSSACVTRSRVPSPCGEGTRDARLRMSTGEATFRQESANTVNPPMSPSERSKSVQCRLTARSGSMHAYIGLLYTTFALSVWHGQSWANICVVRLVVRLKYKDVHKPHYAFRRTFLS